ncbi:choline kinase [Photorhabdus hindustanensis]|uniref:Choline kinase n=2 Tax=Photorhabdus hindustanensis TaxID=2918802 RepID=A0A2S8Q8F3_9GAMM|nr:choline kinase [Photorhabdus hindustanensis]
MTFSFDEMKKNINEIKQFVAKLFKLEVNDKFEISVIGGMTNSNYLVKLNNQEIVLRVPGRKTECFINRYHEKVNSELTSSLGINVPVFYFDHNTGLKATKFLSGSETLSPINARNSANIPLISKQLKYLHQSDLAFNNSFNVFTEFHRYWSLLHNKIIPYPFEHTAEVLDFFHQIEAILNNLGLEHRPCHNDLVAENILKLNENVYFIDWEYSGINDPMFDIAALFLECGYTQEEQKLFLAEYFGENIMPNALEKILLFQFSQDVLWTIWTIVKEENGEKFGNYGINRLKRAYKLMERYKNSYVHQL